MTEDVTVVAPDAPLEEAARLMRDCEVGALPVCDGERLVGIVTDRDIVKRALAAGESTRTTTVRSVMTTDLVWIRDDESLEEAAKIMCDRQIRRLPVLDENKQLVGMLSLGDLSLLAKDKVSGDALEKISQPAPEDVSLNEGGNGASQSQSQGASAGAQGSESASSDLAEPSVEAIVVPTDVEFLTNQPEGEAVSGNELDSVRDAFEKALTEARRAAAQVRDAKASAAFETSAEVVGGLLAAFEHLEEGQEPAWRDKNPAGSR